MATPRLDTDRAAEVLVAAALSTDKDAAERHGVSVRSIQRYRKRQQQDADLAEAVAYKLRQLVDESGWAREASATIRDALAFIKRACKDMNPASPDSVLAVTTALATLVDADIALRLLDASLTPPTAEASRESPAPGEAVAPATDTWGRLTGGAAATA